METYFEDIVDVEFTAELEDKLDKVEEGEMDWKQILRDFSPPFEQTLSVAEKGKHFDGVRLKRGRSRTSRVMCRATSAAR